MDAVDITVDKLRDILEKNLTILFYIFPNMFVWIEERQDGSQVFLIFSWISSAVSVREISPAAFFKPVARLSVPPFFS